MSPLPQDRWLTRGGSYEYRVVRLAPGLAPDLARQLVRDQTEYGRWEMARSAIYWGGEKRVWLRRKVLHVESTLSVW